MVVGARQSFSDKKTGFLEIVEVYLTKASDFA